jgi:hypothetical protein
MTLQPDQQPARWDDHVVVYEEVFEPLDWAALLRISVGVVFHRLQRAEDVQCAAGELRIDQDVLKRDDQAVTSE